jgi:hypothetical protein
MDYCYTVEHTFFWIDNYATILSVFVLQIDTTETLKKWHFV